MTRRAWVLFGTISLLWGVPYLLIKIAIAELDPSVIVFARVAMAAIVLLPVALVRGALPLMLIRWRAVLALVMLEIVAPFLLIAYGETHITSALAGLLIAADPLFIALLALRLDHSEGLSRPRLTGLLLGFLGVVALLGLDLRGDTLGLVGAGFILLAALCYAGGTLLIKRWFSDVAPIGSVAASLAIAAIPLGILAASHLPVRMPSGPVVVSVVVLGLACTAFGFLIYFGLIAEAGATSAALVTYVNPAVAVALGALTLGEPITTATVAGFTLILVGCWLSTGGTLRRMRAAPVFYRPESTLAE